MTSSWSSCGRRVEVADDQPLHHHANQHHEERASDDGEDEGPGIAVGDPAGIAAEHEHRAMRQVKDAERAIDDRQAGGNQRQQRAEHQPVEALRYEVGPVDHASARLKTTYAGLLATILRSGKQDPQAYVFR